MIEDLTVRFIAWWRINVSGQLRLGEFLRFTMAQKPERTCRSLCQDALADREPA